MFPVLDPGFFEIIKPKLVVVPEFEVWKESVACEKLWISDDLLVIDFGKQRKK